MSTIQYKVLSNDLTSPYQKHSYDLGVWYEESRIGEKGECGCVRGLYAGPIESLLYRGVWRDGEDVYRCECDGKCVEQGPLKVAWERMRIIERMTPRQVQALARRHHARLGYSLAECLYPVHPLMIERGEVTPKEIALVRQWSSVQTSVRTSVGDSVWDSVGASVGDSVWDSVGASVGDSVRFSVGDSVQTSVRTSVWDSVGAYTGSLFPGVEHWKYIAHEPGVYPFQAGAGLWRAGLVPSFDGRTWRLHSGPDAAIVWEG